MYTVIHFEEDDTVEAVPSYWFSEDQCAWPILRSNIKRFIEKKIKPNDLEFYMLKARKLCGEISSLSDAKKLATKATCTSNLSGDDIRAARMKKKNSKNTINDPPMFKTNDINQTMNHNNQEDNDDSYFMGKKSLSYKASKNIHKRKFESPKKKCSPSSNLLSLEDDSKMKKARSSIFDVSSSDDEHLSTQSNSPHISVHQPSTSSYAHQPIAYNLQPSVSTSTYTNNEPSISTYIPNHLPLLISQILLLLLFSP
ncbi:uncharacterized protein LOC126549702 isoform X2 [Aphis gossypii]|uniref:uncharacterized protein LOC126549702 isoform X2 n=1 Tax=Aphis gossypii TaxID=80765 RepID=UPI00215978A3|nr:uncharacterized protein LOC126549702 isoform X2 [Aphis gossypii]